MLYKTEIPFMRQSIIYSDKFIILMVMLLTVSISSASVRAAEKNGLPLSGMRISITSAEHRATFQLYDTAAAKELYSQLPLKLKLSNFADAQWMFYPPRRLTVAASAAYHDGKKGELSYYAPWGDVFMLYKDFHATDKMHRLGINLSGIDNITQMSGEVIINKISKDSIMEKTTMQIQVSANGKKAVFELNDSQAAKDLFKQLPLEIKVEDYASNEKIFYPPEKLGTATTPLADAQAGTLAYYAPWGDVVMFYRKFGSAAGLYELGKAIAGSENIQLLSGKIVIEKFQD